METTLFSIETKAHTYYVDYNDEQGTYDVHKDEKFCVRRYSLGDALEYIFNKLGTTTLKTV